jgi:hypothetical protein
MLTPAIYSPHSASNITAIESLAEELGIDLKESDLSSDNISSTETSLKDLARSRESLKEFGGDVKFLRENLTKTLKTIADSAEIVGAKDAVEFLKEYHEKLDPILNNLFENALESSEGKGKYAKSFGKIIKSTENLVNQGLEMVGFTETETPEKERMRKILMIALSIIAGLVLKHFGISPEMLALAGVIITSISESKSKTSTGIFSDVLKSIYEDKGSRQFIEKSALGFSEEIIPGLKTLALSQNIEKFDHRLIKAVDAKELIKRGLDILSSLPNKSLSSQDAADEIFSNLKKILCKTTNSKDSSGKITTKLSTDFESYFKDSRDNLESAVSELIGKKVEKLSFESKAKKLAELSTSIFSFIDEFKNLVSKKHESNKTEKLLLESSVSEMKNFAYLQYAKPLELFIDLSQKANSKDLMEKLKFSPSFKDEILAIMPSYTKSITH